MIGIMADSHDNLHAIRRAVRLFNEKGCSLVIHAGDFVAPFSVRELGNLSCPVKGVFGNCDGEKRGLEKALRPIGEIKDAPLIFRHDGLNLLVMHLNSSLEPYLSSGEYDVLIFAHTHWPEIRKEKKTIVINPGETGGWLSGNSTVAVLDEKTIHAEIITLGA